MPSNEVLRKTIEIFERYELFGSEIVRLSTRRDDINRLERVEFVKSSDNGKLTTTDVLFDLFFVIGK